MDFSKTGAVDGIKHGVTVAAYVALSGAVVALGQYLSGIHVASDQIVFSGLLLIANGIIAGLERWLATKQQ